MTELGAVCTCGHQWIMHASNGQCTRTTCACCQFKELPMTEQLPRAIAAEDIQPGDTVYRIFGTREYMHRDTLIIESIEIDRHGERRGIAGGSAVPLDDEVEWQLVSRPEPPREIGSRWRDDDSKVCYVRASDGHYLPYNYRHQMLASLVPGVPSDDRIIANLTALDPS